MLNMTTKWKSQDLNSKAHVYSFKICKFYYSKVLYERKCLLLMLLIDHQNATHHLMPLWFSPRSPFNFISILILFIYYRSTPYHRTHFFLKFVGFLRSYTEQDSTQTNNNNNKKVAIGKANLHCMWCLSWKWLRNTRLCHCCQLTTDSIPPKYNFPIHVFYFSSLETCSKFPWWIREIGNVDLKCLQSLEK